PPGEERGRLARGHQRPDASPKAAPEGGRGHGAVGARGPRQSDRLRNLVAKQPLRQRLRALGEAAKLIELASSQRIGRRRNDLAFVEELIETVPQVAGRKIRESGALQELPHPCRGVGRACDGVEESAVVASGLPPPSLQDRASGERQMVIAISRGSG